MIARRFTAAWFRKSQTCSNLFHYSSFVGYTSTICRRRFTILGPENQFRSSIAQTYCGQPVLPRFLWLGSWLGTAGCLERQRWCYKNQEQIHERWQHQRCANYISVQLVLKTFLLTTLSLFLFSRPSFWNAKSATKLWWLRPGFPSLFSSRISIKNLM